MPAYRRLLKDKNGNIIYPVTGGLNGDRLLAVMSMYASADGTQTYAVNSTIAWSDTKVGAKTVSGEIDPHNLVASSGGAILYTHKPGVRYIEAEVTFGGQGYGIWQNQNKNYNDLNGAVIVNSDSSPLKTLGGAEYNYGGCTFKVLYNVSGMVDGDSFYINPKVTAYGTTMRIGWGGIRCSLDVKVYGE